MNNDVGPSANNPEHRSTAAREDNRPLARFSRDYLAVCNAHEFTRLDQFVSDTVVINGVRGDIETYVRGLQTLVAVFTDYRWELASLVVDEPWIAARLVARGRTDHTRLEPPGAERSVETLEFAMYRIQQLHTRILGRRTLDACRPSRLRTVSQLRIVGCRALVLPLVGRVVRLRFGEGWREA